MPISSTQKQNKSSFTMPNHGKDLIMGHEEMEYSVTA